MNEYFKNNFTEEEIEILRCVLLERSTHFTKKIVSDRISKLKTQDVNIAQVFQENIDYNFKYKNVIDKLYSLLKERN